MKTIVILAVLIVGGAGVFLWQTGLIYYFLPEEQQPEPTSDNLTAPEAADMDRAIAMIHAARDKFANVKDYECTYLRDEFIDDELTLNTIRLKVRHEPFSVYMEWLSPKKKSGRKAAWIDGENGGKMVVKSIITLRLDPIESVNRKESRHVITEAGMKNMIDRYCTAWAQEKEMGSTEVQVQDGELHVRFDGREVKRPCTTVTASHKPKDKGKFIFYRVRLHFDKETGLPIRMEGYDWPKSENDVDGLLLERYTYLDMKTNLGLTAKDFKW